MMIFRPTRPPRPSPVTYFPGGGKTQVNVIATTTTTTTTTTSTSTTTISTTATIGTTTTTRSTTTTLTTTTSLKPGQVKDATILPPASNNAVVPSLDLIEDDLKGGCGIPQVRQFCASGRIVNGTQSCYGQFPWQVNRKFDHKKKSTGGGG